MADLEAELLADLGLDVSSDEADLDLGQESGPDPHPHDPILRLLQAPPLSIQDRLQRIEADAVAATGPLKAALGVIHSKIAENENDDDADYRELVTGSASQKTFILHANELSSILSNEISDVHGVLQRLYGPVFPELASLVPNGPDYARCVLLLRSNLAAVRQHEKELQSIVSTEKVLVIIMAAVQQSSRTPEIVDMEKVQDVCHYLLELHDTRGALAQFLAARLARFAPNLSAVVGPVTAAQLLVSTGSLRQLSLVPSCNIASLGVKDMSSRTKVGHIRATGYLYNSESVSDLPDEVVKQAMRIISGKVVLAARIDLSQTNPEGTAGQKYRAEIDAKIEKLLLPPENRGDKALPAPVEQKSKKRGGRRFRKLKERFQMSELRKAQNKMEFGKEEDTVMDAFGEEIGLGMSRSNGALAARVNGNTGAKMSKAMVGRLQQQKRKMQEEDLESMVFLAPTKEETSGDAHVSKWFKGMGERQATGTD